jgi:hypothetical protein
LDQLCLRKRRQPKAASKTNNQENEERPSKHDQEERYFGFLILKKIQKEGKKFSWVLVPSS